MLRPFWICHWAGTTDINVMSSLTFLVRGSRPISAVLCPWARHFTPRKYWLITQEAMAPSRHDWKIVDWDVKPQHNQPTLTFFVFFLSRASDVYKALNWLFLTSHSQTKFIALGISTRAQPITWSRATNTGIPNYLVTATNLNKALNKQVKAAI